MGDFDSAKQQDVIYDLRGMHFTGCAREQTDDHTYPIAGLLSAEAANWRDIGNQADTVADDLEAALNRLTMKWTGKAAAEFAKNVGKVVAYARSIAHTADTTRTAPPAGAATPSDPFTAPASQSGQRQVLESLEHSVATYASADKVKDPIWERDRWWWKWYDTWHYNFEVRAGEGDGSVVHGDINGGGFEDFMRQHGIESHDVSDGPLVSHPLPKDWENQVKAFEAKQYNDDGSCDDLATARGAGNNLAGDFTEQQDKFPTAPQPPQFALANPAGVDVPGGGGPGIPTGGGSPSMPGGSSGPGGTPHVPGFSPDGSPDDPDVPDVPDPTDSDHDGIPDASDPHPHDQDNDGIPDSSDMNPNDPTNGADGSGGSGDLGSDGDGIPDVSDSYPNDPANGGGVGSGGSGGLDSDGDGVPDASDPFPNDPANRGGAGMGGSGGVDSDGDGIPDFSDTYPHDPASGGTAVPGSSVGGYGAGGSPGTSDSDYGLPGSADGTWSNGLDGASGSAGTGNWPADGADVDTGSELARAGGAGSGLSAGSGSIGPAGAETAGVGAGVGGAGTGGSGASSHAVGASNAAGAGRGMAGGMILPMMGAGLGGDNPTESSTWLSEDEDIWGTGAGDHAPAVLGGSL